MFTALVEKNQLRVEHANEFDQVYCNKTIIKQYYGNVYRACIKISWLYCNKVLELCTTDNTMKVNMRQKNKPGSM